MERPPLGWRIGSKIICFVDVLIGVDLAGVVVTVAGAAVATAAVCVCCQVKQ